MGKAAVSAPESEMAAAILAVNMQIKISQEAYTISLSDPPLFLGDSEIVFRMIDRDDPADLLIFNSTCIMEIAELTNSDSGFWCSGTLNPADLLPRTGSTMEKLHSESGYMAVFSPYLKLIGFSNHVRPSSRAMTLQFQLIGLLLQPSTCSQTLLWNFWNVIRASLRFSISYVLSRKFVESSSNPSISL